MTQWYDDLVSILAHDAILRNIVQTVHPRAPQVIAQVHEELFVIFEMDLLRKLGLDKVRVLNIYNYVIQNMLYLMWKIASWLIDILAEYWIDFNSIESVWYRPATGRPILAGVRRTGAKSLNL